MSESVGFEPVEGPNTANCDTLELPHAGMSRGTRLEIGNKSRGLGFELSTHCGATMWDSGSSRLKARRNTETKAQLPVTVDSDYFAETSYKYMISSYLSSAKPPEAKYFKGNHGLSKPALTLRTHSSQDE